MSEFFSAGIDGTILGGGAPNAFGNVFSSGVVVTSARIGDLPRVGGGGVGPTVFFPGRVVLFSAPVGDKSGPRAR